MLNQEQTEQMLYQLPSFYQEFLPIDNNLLKLFNVYAKTINYAWDVFREANDSKYISTTPTVSSIPYFKVSINEAIYDENTARNIQKLSFEEQLAYLDKESKFARFVFSKAKTPEPIVYGMRLLESFNDIHSLKLYQDYFIRSNTLYLLPEYIIKRKKNVQYLHAFDIKLNDFTLEQNFGSHFNLDIGPLLPRYEYRDVIESYLRAYKGQMTIKTIKEAIQLATKWENVKIEDRLSPSLSPRKKELYDQWFISPFRFLVVLPESLIADIVKVNIVRNFLKEVKEVQYDYLIYFDLVRKEDFTIGETATITHFRLRIPRTFIVEMGLPQEGVGFSCAANTDLTTHFELYSAPTEEGPYTLVETVANNPNTDTIYFQHTANESGNLYYKSRSKYLESYSLFTLPINILETMDDAAMIDELHTIFDEYGLATTMGAKEFLSYLFDLST